MKDVNQGITGYQSKTARRSLNYIPRWGIKRGIHYWEVGNTNVLLVQGQLNIFSIDQQQMEQVQPIAGGTSTIPTYGLADILEASYRQITEQQSIRFTNNKS